MINNFVDPETKEEFHISSYIVVVNSGQKQYLEKKTRRPLKNPRNGNLLEELPREDVPYGLPIIGKSGAKLQESLKKRSKEHYKKEVEEVKNEMTKKAVNNFNSL